MSDARVTARKSESASPLIWWAGLLGVAVFCVYVFARFVARVQTSDVALGILDLLPAFGLVTLVAFAAWGWGEPFRPLLRRARERHAIEAACGLSVLLSIWHALGAIGLLSTLGAWIGLGVGITLGVRRVLVVARQGTVLIPYQDQRVALVLGGACVLFVSLLVPFGSQWQSEFGAYDSLSYHLQLPREWIAMGAIRPVEHNVYSYLPSYMESAFAQGALLMGASDDSDRFGVLLAGSGWRAHFPSAFHALITLAGAWIVARLSSRLAGLCGVGTSGRSWAGWIGAGLMLSTPWVIVVGSMAYNEMAVVALGAAAFLVALERRVPASLRWGIAALLVGVACGCKPTAIFMLAPAVGVLLLAGGSRKRLPRDIAIGFPVGLLVGIVSISPWLVRNTTHGGNPVFPAMTSTFGAAHWSDEQVDRFRQGHVTDGGFAQGAQRVVWPISDDARGLGNRQWGWLGFGGLVCAVALICVSRSRRLGIILVISLAMQLLAWILLTHQQSRFLIPLVPLLCVSCAVAAVTFARSSRWTSILPFLSGAMVLSQVAALIAICARTPGFTGIGAPVDALTGEFVRKQITPIPGEELRAIVNASVPIGVNLLVPEGDLVYLIGDARGLLFRNPVLLNTTWDAWFLADAIRDSPETPSAWSAYLVEKGVDWVVIDLDETARLMDRDRADPALTPARLDAFLSTLGEPRMMWRDESGRVRAAMYRVGDADDE